MAQAQKSSITLQGSAQMISEFLDFGINSILYQRDVYPPDEFRIRILNFQNLKVKNSRKSYKLSFFFLIFLSLQKI